MKSRSTKIIILVTLKTMAQIPELPDDIWRMIMDHCWVRWNRNQHKRHLESVHSELSDLMDFYHHDYRLMQFDQLVTPKNEAEW